MASSINIIDNGAIRIPQGEKRKLTHLITIDWLTSSEK